MSEIYLVDDLILIFVNKTKGEGRTGEASCYDLSPTGGSGNTCAARW